MDVSHILENLNDEQRQAVTAEPSHMLVLAGAGSGKTRVLVHRIAWLLQVENVSPHAILAVTFTNKAANEMRARIEELLHMPTQGMWVGTFHSLAHRFLRAHWQAAGLKENFQIIDSDDQLRIIKRINKSLNLDDDKWPAKQSQWFINSKKEEGLRAANISSDDNEFARVMSRTYQAYEQVCEQTGLLDFAELLLRMFETLRQQPELLAHYQQRFRHVLVDEFQDTNTIQYAWLRLLVGKDTKMMAVGDDDQSIYGWRGAKIENIHRLTQDFTPCTTIRLEQNYRSTQAILTAANALIKHNTDRLGKNLWTQGAEGEPIQLYSAYNEFDEARFVVERIQGLFNAGVARSDMAILYRSNAQSRILEEALISAAVPYRVYGGLRFYDRAEIKDVLAYLRLLRNRPDDAAFERVINTPARGIGEKTVANIREHARQIAQPLWFAAVDLVKTQKLTARASNAVAGFLALVDDLSTATERLSLAELAEDVLERSGLLQMYQQLRSDNAQTKVENLHEFITACRQFVADENQEEMPELAAFLSHAVLESGANQAESHQDCVQLMTLHAAKGLEFNSVFMVGMEEGLFPHKISLQEDGRLEEERRLCYVGMTRAMQSLCMTYAETRRQYGTEEYHSPSRFIQEIPTEYFDPVRPTYHAAPGVQIGTVVTDEFADAPLRMGQAVMHPKFGQGIVTNYEGNGRHARVEVNFAQYGSKWLVLEYANLSPCTET